jgi:transposase
VLTSGANVPDISRGLDLLDGYPPIAGRPGRPRRRFTTLLADKAYSSRAFRRACRERGTEPIIPKPKTPAIKGLGRLRYVVEQTFALLHQFRRLAVRLGTTPGHPRRPRQPRLRPDLLAAIDQLDRTEIVLGALRRSPPRSARAK